jgi:acetylornithine deacetylase
MRYDGDRTTDVYQASSALAIDAVDRLATRLVNTLSEVVQIPSINPRYPGQRYEDHIGRDSEVSTLLGDLYRSAGADVELVAKEKGRDNACARIPGAGGGSSLMFNGHVDVVPANAERWKVAPFSGRVTDTAVHGRGATDDKGGVVAAAFAAIALKEAGIALKGDLIFQAVVGEETGDHAFGTSAALEAGYTADAAIVVEPTSYDGSTPALATVSAGGLWFSLSMVGKAAHSSLRGRALQPTLDGAHLGVNVVDKFWVVYQALRNLEDEWAEYDRHPDYVPGHFSVLPAVVNAHPTGFDVPFALADMLTVEYSVTHNPARTNREVIDEIERVVRTACSLDPWLREHEPVFEWKLLWEPYTLDASHPLIPAISSAHSAALGVSDGSLAPIRDGFFGLCDITWLTEQGVDGVMYGPGVGNTAHAEDEYVPIDQLLIAAKTYALTAIRFCGVAD